MTVKDYRETLQTVLKYKKSQAVTAIQRPNRYMSKEEIDAYTEGYKLGLEEAIYTLQNSSFLEG